MKMMESSIKWSMNRNEQRQVKHEKIDDAAEIMNRRQQEAEEMKAQTAGRTMTMQMRASKEEITFSVQGDIGIGSEMLKPSESE